VPAPSDLRSRADAARLLVAVSPLRALDAADAVLARSQQDHSATVTALRARALALRMLSQVSAGHAAAERAVRLADRHGLDREGAEARLTYATMLLEKGRFEAALAECGRALVVLKGRDAGPGYAQRALVLSRAGRAEEALLDYQRALPLLRSNGDVHFQCRVYLNRSNLLAYLGRLPAAARDLQTGRVLATAYGLSDLVAQFTNNLGFLHTRSGDIPTALRLFGEATVAAPTHAALVTVMDRADALLLAGLPDEARRSLEARLPEISRGGHTVDVAEWLLTLAHACLLEGDAEGARSFAKRATREFRRQKRSRWALLAQQLEIRARWASGERTAALAGTARDTHARLATAGWREAALQCLIVAGRVELDRGRPGAAQTDLAQAGRATRSGSAQLRVAAWYAQSLLRVANGDARGAATAVQAGLRVVDDHAASLGATDLRVHAAGLGRELAELGVRLAVDAGRPVAVLESIERFRAGTLRRRPVRPPSDTRLAADLADLRRITAELARATADGHDVRRQRADQLHLEEAVRQRSRHAAGRGSRRRGEPASTLDTDRLLTALGERALVEMIRIGDRAMAVTAVLGRVQLHEIPEPDEAIREFESLRFSLHRIARQHGRPASLAAAIAGASHAARRLDELLMAPVLDAIGDRDLVIVPTGRLHALPWPTLPSCQGRPVSVAPSATSWLAATDAARRAPRRTTPADTVLVAGPGLTHAVGEVRAIGRLYPGSRQLVGKAATVDAVRQAVDGADLAHIAAHGSFRADNPQFSALDLADGPLTVYDLERVRRGPRVLVLSACDSGLSAVHPGDELMGLASAVFSLGTATLVASVVPVDDDATKSLMQAFHRDLSRGLTPSTALAAAQQRVQVDGFVCFGAG
jgi:tetratricopeptide (TPR) repeat protein